MYGVIHHQVGLCSLAQNLHWYSESLSADTFIPRAFRIGVPEEKLAFVEDFRLTACAGLLLWFRERYELHGAAGVEDADGEVSGASAPRLASTRNSTRRVVLLVPKMKG